MPARCSISACGAQPRRHRHQRQHQRHAGAAAKFDQASVTDPYFLDRNLVAGVDVFFIQTNFLGTEPYDESRQGFAPRLGYAFNEHLRQVWSYSLVNRNVFNVDVERQPVHPQ